ncbi:MAG: TonB-dependent receptor plug domain-containing protein [Chitinophagales bacterium]
MKTLLHFCLMAFILLSLPACTGVQGTQVKQVKNYSNYTNLADALRGEPGVDVMGVGNNVSILVRGISSINLETRPLFVIDNVPLGTDYNVANNLINVKNIETIRVLKGSSATTRYGEQGTNGVILIKTKTSGN